MLHAFIAHAFRDRFHRLAGSYQGGGRLFQPHAAHRLLEGHSGFIPDVFGEIGAGQVKILRRPFQRHIPVILPDVLQDPDQALLPLPGQPFR